MVSPCCSRLSRCLKSGEGGKALPGNCASVHVNPAHDYGERVVVGPGGGDLVRECLYVSASGTALSECATDAADDGEHVAVLPDELHANLGKLRPRVFHCMLLEDL